MKSNKKRFLILSIVATLALTSMSGCGYGKEDSNESDSSSGDSTTISDEDALKQPITFYYSTDEDEDDEDDALDDEDPTASSDDDSDESSSDSSSDSKTEYVTVTEADGTPATTYVEVTDSSGETVTDSDGETVTESVEVTSVVSGSSRTVSNTTSSDSTEYTANMDEAWAMWIDISKDEDYVFNGAFIEVTFKIKDTTPDGVYDVVITDPDFANLDNGGSTVVPDMVIDGKVYVSEDLEAQREVTDDDGFAVYADNVSAVQGDEVTLTFNLSNNPGLVAMMFKFEYDKNAMTIVECNAVGEFNEVANPSFSDLSE